MNGRLVDIIYYEVASLLNTAPGGPAAFMDGDAGTDRATPNKKK